MSLKTLISGSSASIMSFIRASDLGDTTAFIPYWTKAPRRKRNTCREFLPKALFIYLTEVQPGTGVTLCFLKSTINYCNSVSATAMNTFRGKCLILESNLSHFDVENFFF